MELPVFAYQVNVIALKKRGINKARVLVEIKVFFSLSLFVRSVNRLNQKGRIYVLGLITEE